MRRVLAGLALTLAAGAASAQAPRGTIEGERGVAGVAVAPLEDVNVKKVPIPRVLTAAVADPYDMKGMDACSTLALELARIDEALGPDIDQPPVADTRSRAAKGGEAATDLAKAGVQSLIPFRGVIRQVTGAARYAKEVQDAIEAGSTRRGFLKGVGMRMNCAPPAAPYGFKPAPPQKPRVIRTTRTTRTVVTTVPKPK